MDSKELDILVAMEVWGKENDPSMALLGRSKTPLATDRWTLVRYPWVKTGASVERAYWGGEPPEYAFMFREKQKYNRDGDIAYVRHRLHHSFNHIKEYVEAGIIDKEFVDIAVAMML